MSLDPHRAGAALQASSADLVRVWRSARRAMGEGSHPGVLDGVMEEFLARLAEALLTGSPSDQVWPRTGGVARLPVGPQGAALAEAEWQLAAGVLASAAQALEIGGEVADRIQRAVEVAIEALPVDGPRRPPAVLVVRALPRRPRPAPPGAAPR